MCCLKLFMTLLGNCLTSKWLNYSIAIYIRNFHTVKVDHPPYLMSQAAWKTPQQEDEHTWSKQDDRVCRWLGSSNNLESINDEKPFSKSALFQSKTNGSIKCHWSTSLTWYDSGQVWSGDSPTEAQDPGPACVYFVRWYGQLDKADSDSPDISDLCKVHKPWRRNA